MMLENTLMGNDNPRLMLSKNIKTRAVSYSEGVKPSRKTSFKLAVKNSPQANATTPMIMKRNPQRMFTAGAWTIPSTTMFPLLIAMKPIKKLKSEIEVERSHA